MVRMKRCENEQESTGCAGRSAGGSGGVVAGLFAHLQPQDVYATSVVCVPGAQEFLQPDVSRDRGDVEGLRFLAAAIGLEKVPHFTTLQKACDRLLLRASFQDLLDATLRRARKRKLVGRRPRMTALDSSGFESHHVSRYFTQRRKTSGKHGRKHRVEYRRYPKLSLICDARSHLILAARTGQGPLPDCGEFEPLLRETLDRVRPKTVAADAGFDSEANHQLARDELGIQSLIPATAAALSANLLVAIANK